MMIKLKITPGIQAFFIIFFLLIFSKVSAQIEKVGKEEADKRIERASYLMYNGHYLEADEEYKFVLDNAQTLNPDICYYFGVNSLFLKKYKQSINWLNKYLELKGANGEFSDKSAEYLAIAEKAYLAENKNNPSIDNNVEQDKELEPDNYKIHNIIDCEKYGKIICPVCKGKGVIIKEGLFGKEYNTCPYGDDYGYMSCEDYNLLLQGKLTPNKKN